MTSYHIQGQNATVARLAALSGDLWVAEHPLRVAGVEFGRRMTVVRLPSGELWLHSVAWLSPELRADLETAGPVRFLVAPNRFHSRYLRHYHTVYPEARLFAAPGLPERRPEIAFDAVLGETPDPAWAGVLDQLVFAGNPTLQEVVFFHPASRTLILTDLCFNFPPDRPLITRLAARALGVYDRLAVSRTVRFTLRDRQAARASLARIMAWDFDRVIIGHGTIVESGGKTALRHAFAWLRP